MRQKAFITIALAVAFSSFGCDSGTEPAFSQVTVENRAEVQLGSTTIRIPFDINVNGVLEKRNLEFGQSHTIQDVSPGVHSFEFSGEGFIRYAELNIVGTSSDARLVVYADRVECPTCG